jgi:uncharacterized YigZ family protein
MQTISKSGQAEQTINKSRFIAVVRQCSKETEVVTFLRGLAQAHPQANHLAFAFQLKTSRGIVQRMNDAGEPSGTAGRPILQHIEGRDLVNTCVGVIRYYGGINLGTGGLARAYGGTAKLAIDAARIIPFVEMQQLRFVLEYASLDPFTRELEGLNGKILDKQFAEQVEVVVLLPMDCVVEFRQRYGVVDG